MDAHFRESRSKMIKELGAIEYMDIEWISKMYGEPSK